MLTLTKSRLILVPVVVLSVLMGLESAVPDL